MGLCGTDMIHHQNFLKEAENYRRYLIKTLNDKHAYGGSRTGDWKWTVGSNFFKSIDDFSHQIPKITSQMEHYLIDMICLLFWGFMLPMIIKHRTNRDLV